MLWKKKLPHIHPDITHTHAFVPSVSLSYTGACMLFKDVPCLNGFLFICRSVSVQSFFGSSRPDNGVMLNSIHCIGEHELA